MPQAVRSDLVHRTIRARAVVRLVKVVRPVVTPLIVSFLGALGALGCESSPSAVCATKRDCPTGQQCVGGECRDRSYEAPDPMDSAPDASLVSDAAVIPDAGSDPSEPDASEPMAECTADQHCAPPNTVCERERCVAGCATNPALSCGPGTVCDTATTGRCVSVPSRCTTDSECVPPAFVCEQSQCIRGCAHPGGLQCTGATRCEPNTGRCVAAGDFCTRDSDCAPPATVCNLLSGACDPGCTAATCIAPATCSPTTGRCAGACTADSFEPNNTAAAARATPTAVQPDLSICLGDDDYYSIFLTLDDVANIEVIAGIAEGDLDVEAFGPDGALAGGAHAVGGGETYRFTAAATGVHIIRVYLVTDTGNNAGSEYAFDVQVELAPCADTFEPNDSLMSAATPALGSGYSGLLVCTQQDDWFAYTLAAGEEIDVAVMFADAEGDIDVSLLDANEVILASSLSTDDNEQLSYTVSAAGTYYVHVFLYSESGSQRGNSYTLSVSTGQTPAPLPNNCNDSYEPNDSAAAAAPIVAGNYPALGICSGGDDYYELSLISGDQLDVDVLFTQAEGDIDITLIGPTGSVVASSAGIVSNEHFAYTVPSSADYVLRVYLYRDTGSSTGNSYTLDIAY